MSAAEAAVDGFDRLAEDLDLVDAIRGDPSSASELLAEAAELAADAALHLVQLETPSEILEAAGVACRVTAGAGGAEAQDWAVMLHGMYRRWAASRGLDHESTAELLVVRGAAGAELLGEHGVHRLARFSPHDPRRRLQTSFASVAVTPLESQRPEKVAALPASEVRVETFRGSGPGGQHRNTRDTAVRAVHVPTGLAAVCTSSRSQHHNRRQALRVLAGRVASTQAAPAPPRATSAARGAQVRSYVLHPRPLVVDHRTGCRSRDPFSVLAGNLDEFIQAWTTYSS